MASPLVQVSRWPSSKFGFPMMVCCSNHLIVSVRPTQNWRTSPLSPQSFSVSSISYLNIPYSYHFLVFQVIGGAFAIAAAQAGFVSRLVSTLAKSAPNVIPADVVATGATQIRAAFPNDIAGVVFAYMAGLKVAWALVVGMAGITCLIGIFAPWGRLNMSQMQGGAA
jgi:hypothetical protein